MITVAIRSNAYSHKSETSATTALSPVMEYAATCPTASQHAQKRSIQFIKSELLVQLDAWHQALPEQEKHNLQTVNNLNYCSVALRDEISSLSTRYSCDNNERRFYIKDEPKSVAIEELWISLKNFDPSLGYTLSHFLRNRIHGRLRSPKKPNLAKGRIFGDTCFPYTRYKKRPDGAAPIRRRNPSFVSLDAAVVANEASFASTDTGTSQVYDTSAIAAAATAALSPAAHQALLHLPAVWGDKRVSLSPYYIKLACTRADQAHATQSITAELLALRHSAQTQLVELSA
ncbi:MAG: hypothetical protein WCJ10_04565 [Opitutaceae bacterium]